MIQFSGVTKHYPGHVALDNISFQLARGEMAFLTGHSGAGKTTLLKIITLVERMTQGQVIIDDRNITRLKRRHIPALRKNIGMIFQNPQLIPNRTVFENVAVPLHIEGYRPREIRQRVHAALDKVGLLDKENQLPAALSSGEQQRIGIARAIVNKPDLILADEPTGNLDPSLSQDIMKLFEAFNEVGVTVLIATHDLSLVAPMNHRMITLKDGQLIGG